MRNISLTPSVPPGHSSAPAEPAAPPTAPPSVPGTRIQQRPPAPATKLRSPPSGTPQDLRNRAADTVIQSGTIAPCVAAARIPQSGMTNFVLERSIGMLAQTFEQNMNPVLRTIVQGIGDHTDSLGRFNELAPANNRLSNVNRVLADAGIDVQLNHSAAIQIVSVAKELNVNAVKFASQLIHTQKQAKSQLTQFNPQNPLLINGANPETITAAVSYMSTLLAQGVKVPAQKANVTIDGEVWRGTVIQPKLHTTAMNSDIDGPFAASYGQQGIDVVFSKGTGEEDRLHLQLPAALEGTPTNLKLSPSRRDSSLEVVLTYQTGTALQAESGEVAIPISSQQMRMIKSNESARLNMNYVEGLSARHFSPESVHFWQQVSNTNALGGEFHGGVKSPAVVFNTFGSHGTTAFLNAAELVTSFARSLPPRSLPKQIEPGIFDAPNVRVYSGGTTLNEQGTSTPIGLSAAQQTAMRAVATALPALVSTYSKTYHLSPEATAAWQNSIFANPDIPSIIIPNKTLSEFSQRTEESHPNLTFAHMQRQIEADLSALVERENMSGFVKLHHTPSAPGDTLAEMVPAGADGRQSEFTTEWQFAVNGQKAMPVLDAVANDLKSNFNIDLKQELEDQGHSYGEIRQMNLDDTVNFFANFVRERIDNFAKSQKDSERGSEPEAHRQVTPNVIVPVDTYYEKKGRVDGSDASLIRSAAALYTPERMCVIQVDTGGGKETVGRSALFKIETDEAGKPVLRPQIDGDGKGPVDPEGPNASLAPTVYARSAADMGKVFDQAYRNQTPLSAEEVDRVKNRQMAIV